MSQLYARVFTTILDSSIAEDYETRHVFEDLLKVCTIGDNGGIVDMTRQALARKFNMPLEKLNAALDKLEAPDPNSRSHQHEGRRIERLNEHRDWGWQILNWKEYEKIKTRADVAARVAKHRAMKTCEESHPKEEEQRPRSKEESVNNQESIYEAYPRKVGKPKALVSIQKAISKYGYSKILERTERYAASTLGSEQRFIPHPSTWFNQERFNDDPSTWNNANNQDGAIDPDDPTILDNWRRPA